MFQSLAIFFTNSFLNFYVLFDIFEAAINQ